MAWLNYSIVFLFGLIWGLVELLLRYNDWSYIFCSNNNKSVYLDDSIKDGYVEKEENLCVYVSVYMLFNGLISIFAFYLIRIMSKESIADINTIDINSILIAGFSGMAILRCSLFSITYNNKAIEIGPASATQSLLNKIDGKINHNIAARRMCEIYNIMKDVDFELAKEELPILCIKYIDNFTAEDSNNLIDGITKINDSFNPLNKSLLLGREISKYCELDILKRAVKRLPYIMIDKTKTIDTGNKDYDELKKKLSE